MARAFIFKKGVSVFIALSLMAFGCSSTNTNTLQLDNILVAEAERLAKKAEKAKLKVQEEAKKAQEAMKAGTEPSLTPEEALAQSKTDPPELALLSLPKDFYALTGQEKNVPDILKLADKLFPKGTLVWKAKDLDITVLAWKTRTDPDRIKSLSKEEFMEELKKVGGQFDTFYKKAHESRASIQAKEKGSIIAMEITSKYFEEGLWRTAKRHIFFYKPDYRLNVAILGKDEDLEKKAVEIDASVKAFQSKLARFFAGKLSFSEK